MRNYQLDSQPKKQKYKENLFILCVGIFTVLGVLWILNKPEQTQVSVPEDILTEKPVISTEVTELPSSVASMMQAGSILAEKQNDLISENNAYLTTVRNAQADGYKDPVLMTDTYKNLVDTFHDLYMKEPPKGVTGVLWSEYGQWEFSADYDYAAENNPSMKAVWLCYDTSDTEKKHPFAVCTATYVTESDTFIEASLSKTEWYPSDLWLSEDAALAGAPNDVTVSADQCGDPDADNGSNDEGVMTEEQERVRAELQKQIDASRTKENAVSISH